MSNVEPIQRVVRDRQLASLGDAFINFVYSLALTQISGHPKGVKVSDKILSEAFKLAGLRQYLGTAIIEEGPCKRFRIVVNGSLPQTAPNNRRKRSRTNPEPRWASSGIIRPLETGGGASSAGVAVRG